MSDLLNTAQLVRAGAKHLEWMKQLADALERVGSIEQAETEAQDRLDATRQELEGLTSSCFREQQMLNDLQEEREVVQVDRAREIQEHRKEVEYLLDEARREAAGIVANGNNTAARLVEEARQQVTESEQALQAIKETASATQRELTDAGDELQSIRDEVTSAKAEAAEVFKRFTQ